MKICLGCMEHYEEQFNVCPHCGFVEGTKPNNPLHISPGSVMQGENSSYTIGKVLGFGSFGVTYIAWDNVLERKVAIKEYMPSEYSTRSAGRTMVEITPEKRELFNKGMEKFIEEARKLAKFESEEGIVRIFDHFYQNDTAYIVMEHLDGITLTEYLEKNGKIKPQMAVDMIMPIMESLKKVNDMGIIHRDIAPDNIMITKDGSIKLIDFGAARFASSSSSKSLTVMVKQGYSPEEQYRRRGDQGPHTDVYSLAATLYKMITGVTPPDALKRRAALENEKKNILVPIRNHNRKISRIIENAIYNAMNIKIEDRTQNIEQFIAELTAKKPVKLRDQSIPLIDRLRWKPWQIITASVSSIIVIALIVLLATGVIHFDNLFEKEFVMPEGMTRVPQLINKELPEGEKLLNDAQLLYLIMGKEPYNAIPKDKIYKQSINSGMLTDINTIVEIWISGGPEMVNVPYLRGRMEEKALEELENANIPFIVMYEYNENPEGVVIKQSYEGGSKIAKGSVMEITVSKGLDPDKVFIVEDVPVPDFTNITYEEALKVASDLNLKIAVEEDGYKYSDKYEKDKIMSQSIEVGTTIKNTEIIYLVISKGKEEYEVPDVVYVAEDEAKKMLEASKLVVSVKYDTHPKATEGLVISQTIAKDTKVGPQTAITIVVSTGKGTFQIPDVVGKDESKAKTELQGLGLRVTVSYEHNDKVSSGKVISQSIAKGTEVTSGDAVVLVISSGEELFEVADVYKAKEKDAKKILGEHFDVSVSYAYSDDVAKGCIVSQTLAAGSKYKKNTEISIVVSLGKEPFTVSFDGNGGNISSESITAYYNVKYGEFPDCSRTGYKFIGWYDLPIGGVEIAESDVHKERGNTTLYAQWKAETYKVTFDGNGGDSKGDIIVTYDSIYGTLPTSSRPNYSFDGWFTKADGGSQITADIKVSITEDQILYAHWTRETLNATFDACGGSVSTGNKTCNKGDTYGDLPTPVWDYHTFNGWYTAPSGGSKVTSSTTVSTSGSQTLYAQWNANAESGWVTQEQLPSDTNSYKISNTKTQYCYRDKQYTKSDSSSITGWTLYNTTSAWSDYGAWSGWSTSAATASDYRQVETRYINPVYSTRYQYFHYCTINGKAWANVYDGYSGATYYHIMNTATQLTTKIANQYGSGYYYTSSIGCAHGCTKWYIGTDWQGNNATVSVKTGGDYYEYRYRDRSLIYTYHFWQWGTYSSWSDTYVAASSERDVATRTMYKYILK